MCPNPCATSVPPPPRSGRHSDPSTHAPSGPRHRGIIAIISQINELNTFTVIVTTMVGLAVGIDYSLLIVQRFREERDRGLERYDAISRAGATASRTVLFSGVAVAIALAGMLIMPDILFKSFGIGTMVVVVTAVAAELTLLPALLGLLGDRVNWFRIPILGRRRAPEGAGRLDRGSVGYSDRPRFKLPASLRIRVSGIVRPSPVSTTNTERRQPHAHWAEADRLFGVRHRGRGSAPRLSPPW